MASGFKERMKNANIPKQTAAQQIQNVTDNREYENTREEETKQADQVIEEEKIPEKEEVTKEVKETPKNEMKNQNKENEKHGIKAEEEQGHIEKDQPGYTDYNGMPYKTVTLIESFHRILKVRTGQLGYTKDFYFDLLLSEEIARVEKIKEEDMEKHYLRIYQLCDKRFKENKERSNIRFSQRMLDFIEKETINSGVTTTAYMNYLFEKEVNREEREGKRQRKE
ncbi:MAG: hypothetical protein K2K56_08810 [Lachnospiraceae bacterium]|nr:hypothetical protein [Lachnospiraceae bacterium]